jgi:DNA-binding transcriptional regulator YdaS (Cro superfamily)
LCEACFAQEEEDLKYPNVLWAISQIGNRYKFAAMIGHSESWLSRRLLGRVPFSPEEQQTIAQALGYPAEWLFQEPQPAASMASAGLVHVNV